MLLFDYRERDRRAVVSWSEQEIAAPWLSIIRDMLLTSSSEARGEGAHAVSLPWWSFLALRPTILDLVRGFRLRSGQEFVISPGASALLSAAHRRAEGYGHALDARRLSPEELSSRLTAADFIDQF